jgi:hypothetical protein
MAKLTSKRAAARTRGQWQRLVAHRLRRLGWPGWFGEARRGLFLAVRESGADRAACLQPQRLTRSSSRARIHCSESRRTRVTSSTLSALAVSYLIRASGSSAGAQ